jgi:hypothetical protein
MGENDGEIEMNVQRMCECANKNFRSLSVDHENISDKFREPLILEIDNFNFISFINFKYIILIFYYFYYYLNVYISFFKLAKVVKPRLNYLQRLYGVVQLYLILIKLLVVFNG